MNKSRGNREKILPIDEVVETTVEETMKMRAPSLETGVVTCHSLNVRKEPSTDSEILRIIHKDMEVKILKDANETWYKVCIPEIKTGFCMKEFIKINK